jgi:hypothetical protein
MLKEIVNRTTDLLSSRSFVLAGPSAHRPIASQPKTQAYRLDTHQKPRGIVPEALLCLHQFPSPT